MQLNASPMLADAGLGLPQGATAPQSHPDLAARAMSSSRGGAVVPASGGRHAGSGGGGQQPFERLTEEEVTFCWRGLADQGQLTVGRLQKFFLDVCGEQLSAVQAKDLLGYMDANGDGRVGMEDFRNFVSTGQLADTDIKSFMWTPKAKYREEHGLDKAGAVHEVVASDAGLQATMNLFTHARRHTMESQLPQPEPFPLLPGAGPTQEVDVVAADAVLSPRPHARPLPHTQPTLGPPTPGPPSTPQTPATPSTPAAHKRGRSKTRTSFLAHRKSLDSNSGLEELVKQEVDKPRPPVPPVDPKVFAKIDAALEKYEQASWERFLREEDNFKRKLFMQFGSSEEANELTVAEFHKMLMRWHRLARWCMPADLRPGDSLAALEYVLRRDRESRGEAAAGGSGAAAAGGGGGGAGPTSEAKLPYRLWLELISGKHRPEEHRTS